MPEALHALPPTMLAMMNIPGLCPKGMGALGHCKGYHGSPSGVL